MQGRVQGVVFLGEKAMVEARLDEPGRNSGVGDLGIWNGLIAKKPAHQEVQGSGRLGFFEQTGKVPHLGVLKPRVWLSADSE